MGLNGLSAIAEVLNQTSLTQLDLAKDNLTDFGQVVYNKSDFSGISKLADALKDATGPLETPNLANNKIGQQGAQKFTDMLKLKVRQNTARFAPWCVWFHVVGN